MNATQLVRTSLWVSAVFNLLVACVLVFPASLLGQGLGLPREVDPIYAALCAFLVALFGLVYAWLALQRNFDQPLLYLGATGKAGVFFVVGVLWLSHAAPGGVVIAASGDLALASLWFWWLMTHRSHEEE